MKNHCEDAPVCVLWVYDWPGHGCQNASYYCNEGINCRCDSYNINMYFSFEKESEYNSCQTIQIK